ncbi:remorin-like [Cajanus cajan]|uniref:remorin-like n=1 Tax=Cajanus cajan TaxID=3821 RepID=UPI0010FBAB3E|nr:remorin-like [Cajanus cajan]
MADLQTKAEPGSLPAPPPLLDAAEKKVVAAPPPPAPAAAEESKALAVVESEKIPDPVKKKATGGSLDRDIALAEIEKEKRLSNVKAWEESEKSKAENKYVTLFRSCHLLFFC